MTVDSKKLLHFLKTRSIDYFEVGLLLEKPCLRDFDKKQTTILQSLINDYEIYKFTLPSKKIRKYNRFLKKELLKFAYNLPGNEKEKLKNRVRKFFKIIGAIVGFIAAIVAIIVGIIKILEKIN